MTRMKISSKKEDSFQSRQWICTLQSFKKEYHSQTEYLYSASDLSMIRSHMRPEKLNHFRRTTTYTALAL